MLSKSEFRVLYALYTCALRNKQGSASYIEIQNEVRSIFNKRASSQILETILKKLEEANHITKNNGNTIFITKVGTQALRLTETVHPEYRERSQSPQVPMYP